jgi:glycosyltransferase involved in cell wall biosynthesis
MKVINVVENLDDTYGGPSKSIPYMCKHLNDFGIQTEILSITFDIDERNSIVSKYKLIWKRFSYSFFRKIRYSNELRNYLEKTLEKDKEIILHVHNLWNYVPYVTYKMAKKYNVPLVVSIRGSLYKWSLQQGVVRKKIAWLLFQKKVLQRASCIHVTAISEMKAVRNLGITTPIAVVENGVQIDEFSQVKDSVISKNRLKLNPKFKYMLFLSRIHPKKGLHLLVNSWLKLIDVHPDWRLLVVGPCGDKKYLDQIISLLKNHDKEDRVIFTGMLYDQDRIDAFESSELFILPSYTENFGIVIAEALAAGIPVITTRETPWQVIQEFSAGWYVEVNQLEIDKALKEALNLNENKLASMGSQGLKLIEQYKWEGKAKKMMSIYNTILDINLDKPDYFHINKKIN